MKLLILTAIILATAASTVSAQELKSQRDKASYAIGLSIGSDFKKSEADLDPALIAKGIQDAFTGAAPAISAEEAREALATLQQDMQKKHADQTKVVAANNLKEGEDFLAENKKQPGVITQPSGLQYKVLKPASGKKPGANDTVTVNYRGTLLDGSEFDSSYKRNTPATFKVNGVIPGWTEALQLMSPGAKWMLYIPAKLAYGEHGAGPIPPNATLIFEVELLSIK